MNTIKKIQAEEIRDSRGNPTINVVCEIDGGFSGEASIPSGKSTGIHEAVDLRDGDNAHFSGLGVFKVIKNLNEEMNTFLQDKSFDQKTLDDALVMLDGTDNKKRLGANAILGVSLSFACACAKKEGIELYQYLGNLVGNKNFTLPLPMLNLINGGKHADSGLDIQEFMIVPVGENSFKEKIEIAKKITSKIENLLTEKGYNINLGDEGGFAPKLNSNEEALDILTEAIFNSKYNIEQVKISIDSASSSFFRDNVYHLKNGVKDKYGMIAWYEELIRKYPIISIEDGLSEDDWEGFTEMNKKIGNTIKIIGDDLTVTNINRINIAIEKKAINGVLIKLNQIGTLSETIEAIKLTKAQNWVPVVSHRSGETMDTFIADLAVGLGCPYIKTGALSQPERMAKYNRLIEIENILNKN